MNVTETLSQGLKREFQVVLNATDLKSRLDPEAMAMAEVRPEAWKDRPWPWLWERFVRLRDFYGRASSEGSGVATWVTPPVE